MSQTAQVVPTPSLAKLLITSDSQDTGLPSPANSNVGSPNQKYEMNHPNLVIDTKQDPSLSTALARDLRQLTPQPEAFAVEISLCGEEESLSIHSDSEHSDDVESPEKKSGPRRCDYCSATSTPMWRHGPGEYTNLCNSCGVKWRRGKILANGENRHHLCKNSNADSANKKISPKKPKSSPLAEKAGVSNISGTKRKASSEYVRSSRKARAVNWTVESSDEDVAIAATIKKVAVEETPILGDSSKSTLETLPVEGVANPISLQGQSQVDPLVLSEPAIKALTNDFATLLDRLTPSKTAEFTAILAKCFEPKVAEAYQAGVEVEMSVLDISQEAWSALKQVVC